MTTGFLSPEDLRRLTGRARANGQEEWLGAEGIPHKRQGSDMLVMWVHVQAWIEGHAQKPPAEPQLRLSSFKDGRSREARQARKREEEDAIARALAENQRRGRNSAG